MPVKFSPSLIKTYMSCSLKAKFNYIDKVPQLQNAAASFGTAVHLALELYNETQDLEAAERCFLYAWDNPEEFDISPQYYFPRTSYGDYRERGIKFIRNYVESYKWVKRDIIATEHRFCVDVADGRHQLSGVVDILETEVGSKQLKIVDLKTGVRPNANNLHFDLQFCAYILAAQQKQFWCGYEPEIDKYKGFENGEELWEKYKDYEMIGVWYDLRNAKEYPVGPRTELDYKKLFYCMDAIEKTIELETFIPDISGDSCGICSYQDICPLWETEVEDE
jgi:CRISPR/Cas system-associated exonuclease Cas4 (RecB family)